MSPSAGTARPVTWERFVYLGRRGTTLAWRGEEASGCSVILIIPLDQFVRLVVAEGLQGKLAGVDQERHEQMVGVLNGYGFAGVGNAQSSASKSGVGDVITLRINRSRPLVAGTP